MPGVERLGKYLGLSSMALSLVVWHAFMTREQFYPAMQHLSSSKFAIATAGNFAFAMGLCLYKLLVNVFLGQLRQAEIERVNERISQAVMETCLALTIFRDEFNVEFCAMFTILTFIKVFHWLVSDRVEYLETTPSDSRLQHVRIVAFMVVLLAIDAAFLRFTVGKVLQRSASVHLLFAFEYVIQASSVFSTAAKYALTMVDAALDNQWESKGTYVFYLELTTDLLHLFVYSVFFIIVFANYGLPLHLVRDVYWTFRTFRNRVADFLRYRRVTANMDQSFPDASEEQLSRADHTCIVCREDMTAGGRNKVLRCGHVFHMHCLRSWLERQQNCPTCRSSVMPEAATTATDARLADILQRANALHRQQQDRRQNEADANQNGEQAGIRHRQVNRDSGRFEAAAAVNRETRHASPQLRQPDDEAAQQQLQYQWQAWQTYYQQLATYQAASHQVHVQHSAQSYQYQAAAAAAVQQQLSRASNQQQRQQPTRQRPPRNQRTSEAQRASSSAAASSGPPRVPSVPAVTSDALHGSREQPATVAMAAPRTRSASLGPVRTAAAQQASRSGIQPTPDLVTRQARTQLGGHDIPARSPNSDAGMPAPWSGFSPPGYGYSGGFAWNVPQWCPQASMATYMPVGYAPFPYAGQQNAMDVAPQQSNYNQIAPVMPMALPPALQAMIPPPPAGASPQQIHNHHAAAAAAAAAAASVMSPYSHHLMAPPSLVPMGGRSEGQVGRDAPPAGSSPEGAAVGVSPAAAAAAANAAAAAAAAAVLSAPSSGGMSIEQLRRRQVDILQTQLEGLGTLHKHTGSPTNVHAGNGDGGASLASPSFPPSHASSRGPSVNLDAMSGHTLPTPFLADGRPHSRNFGDAGGYHSDSAAGPPDGQPASLSRVLSTLARASSQGTLSRDVFHGDSSTAASETAIQGGSRSDESAAVPGGRFGPATMHEALPVQKGTTPHVQASSTSAGDGQREQRPRNNDTNEQEEMRRLRLQRFGS